MGTQNRWLFRDENNTSVPVIHRSTYMVPPTTIAPFEKLALPEAQAYCPLGGGDRTVCLYHPDGLRHTVGQTQTLCLWPRHVYGTLAKLCPLHTLLQKSTSTLIFVPNFKHHCFLMMAVFIIQKRVLKSQRVRKLCLTPKGFPVMSLSLTRLPMLTATHPSGLGSHTQ